MKRTLVFVVAAFLLGSGLARASTPESPPPLARSGALVGTGAYRSHALGSPAEHFGFHFGYQWAVGQNLEVRLLWDGAYNLSRPGEARYLFLGAGLNYLLGAPEAPWLVGLEIGRAATARLSVPSDRPATGFSFPDDQADGFACGAKLGYRFFSGSPVALETAIRYSRGFDANDRGHPGIYGLSLTALF